VGVGGGLSGTIAKHNSAADPVLAVVRVGVVNHANVATDTLEGGKRDVARIFREAVAEIEESRSPKKRWDRRVNGC
jgi:hypothetical protein